MNTATATKPLVYLILGATGSGRRELIADILADAPASGERPFVLLADTELSAAGTAVATVAADSTAAAGTADTASTDDSATAAATIVRWQWHERSGGPEGLNGRIETPENFAAAAARIFFITDGRRNPVDQIEAFKPWLASIGGELARIVCVVNCQLASQHRELTAWYEACIHFSDVALLARRDGVPNKWISDFQARFQKKFYPCLFEFVKAGRVRNPALVLEPEARRMSHYFDDPDYALAGGAGIEEGFDEDEDAPRKRQNDDEIEIVEEIDEYLARRAGGRRVKEIPDVAKFLV